MRYIVSAFARILFVLITLGFFAAPLQADPVVTLMAGGDNPINIPTLNTSIGPFVIDANGQLKVTLRNGTSFTFLDLHIEISPPSNVPITGEGSPFFDVFTPRPDGIDFEVRNSGFGIRPGQTVMIIFDGFRPGTVVTEITGTIPEPASLLLLGTGVAGIAIRARKKLKRRKS